MKWFKLKTAVIIAALLMAVFATGYLSTPTVEAAPIQIPEITLPEKVLSPSLSRGNRPTFESQLAINKYFIGWMTIPGTYTHDPVVLFTDNNYYLKHTLSNQSNQNGTLFVDYRCFIEENYMSQNMTIYGHNLRSGKLFGQLKKYKQLEFYKESPRIIFDTLYGEYEWKIFAMFLTNTLKEHGKLFNYRNPEYYSGESFLNFITQVRRRSMFNIPVDVQEDDRIITLSTCSYEMSDFRFVVMARLTREGEDPGVDVEQATVNKNVLYPEAYHKKLGTKMPVFD